jgi:hypothetical protein
LKEIELGLLEQLQDFEHVVFGQLHPPLSCGRRRMPLAGLWL